MTEPGQNPSFSGAAAAAAEINALPESPYRGLEPYRFCDRDIFFEREVDAERLLRLTTMYRGALLYGESGAGKSSLINAGFIPRLVDSGANVERLRIQPRLGREFVIERIARSVGSGELLPSLLAGASGGNTVFDARSFVTRVREASVPRLQLIFDQFEELLTLGSDQGAQSDSVEARRGILAAIVGLLQDRGIHHLRLLFVFREEYLAKFEQFFYYCPELPDQFLRLTAPRAGALHRLICGPFQSERIPKGHWSREITPDVSAELERMLRPAEEGAPINLSQVQIVALQLWRSDSPKSILEKRGVDGLVSDFLRDQLILFKKDRRTAETLLSLLITTHGTRRIVEAAELLEQARSLKIRGAQVESTIEQLVSGTRLVRRDFNRGTTTYEIVSEFLVPWIRELKLRRAAREARIVWIRRASALVIAIAALLSAIFAWKYQSTTVAAQKQRLVNQAEMARKAAESERHALQKQLEDTRGLLSQGKEKQFKDLTDQLNSTQRALTDSQAAVTQGNTERARLQDQAGALRKTADDASKTLSDVRGQLEAQTTANKALQTQLDTLQKTAARNSPPAPSSASGQVQSKPDASQPSNRDGIATAWTILPDDRVKRVFGAAVIKTYAAVQITIRNTTESTILFACEGFQDKRDKAGRALSPPDPQIVAARVTDAQSIARLLSFGRNPVLVGKSSTAIMVVFLPKDLIPAPTKDSIAPLFSIANVSASEPVPASPAR
jgi:hypothetical protein